eukprot:tig00000317_g24025.t1
MASFSVTIGGLRGSFRASPVVHQQLHGICGSPAARPARPAKHSVPRVTFTAAPVFIAAASPLERDPDFLRAKVYSLGLSEKGYVIFLQPEGQTERVVPLFIGNTEAHSIVAAVNKQPTPRPMTHDLFKNVLEMNDIKIEACAVTEIRDDTFYGRLYLRRSVSKASIDVEDEVMDIDSRPSDAIGLALRFQAPIFIHKEVFEASNVPLKARGAFETGQEEAKAPEAQEDPRITELRDQLTKAEQEERYSEAIRLRELLRESLPELQLGELKRELEIAISEERYDDCLSLQKQIDTLEKKRAGEQVDN